MRTLVPSVALIILAAGLAAAQQTPPAQTPAARAAPAPQPSPCSSPEFKQFDFWVGAAGRLNGYRARSLDHVEVRHHKPVAGDEKSAAARVGAKLLGLPCALTAVLGRAEEELEGIGRRWAIAGRGRRCGSIGRDASFAASLDGHRLDRDDRRFHRFGQGSPAPWRLESVWNANRLRALAAGTRADDERAEREQHAARDRARGSFRRNDISSNATAPRCSSESRASDTCGRAQSHEASGVLKAANRWRED